MDSFILYSTSINLVWIATHVYSEDGMNFCRYPHSCHSSYPPLIQHKVRRIHLHNLLLRYVLLIVICNVITRDHLFGNFPYISRFSFIKDKKYFHTWNVKSWWNLTTSSRISIKTLANWMYIERPTWASV